MQIPGLSVPRLMPLPRDAEIAPNVWVCPGRSIPVTTNMTSGELQTLQLNVCEGGEHYIEISRGPLREYFDSCLCEAACTFMVPKPQETRLVIGRSPLTQLVGDTCFVILRQNSNINQLFRQSGHESYHRVCDPKRRGWVQEMLAESWTMRLLRQSIKLRYYYEYCDQAALRGCSEIDIRELPTWDGGTPYQFYDLAYVCGQRLIELCGWEHFRGLCHAYTTADYQRWVDALPSGMRSDALRIVGL